MLNAEKAKATFADGFNCAQAVLSTYSEKYGVSDTAAKKISCGFGAGCARQSLTCGAVTGAYMVIGLRYGKTRESDENSKNTTYEKVNSFSDQFKLLYGSLNCYELLGCDLATEGGRNYFAENELFDKECMNYVNYACEILDGMGL